MMSLLESSRKSFRPLERPTKLPLSSKCWKTDISSPTSKFSRSSNNSPSYGRAMSPPGKSRTPSRRRTSPDDNLDLQRRLQGSQHTLLGSPISRGQRASSKHTKMMLLGRPMDSNSFLVRDASRDCNYSVVIGPQTCSCGTDGDCLHISYIMCKVLQVAEASENKLKTSQPIPDEEVDFLLRQLSNRRTQKIFSCISDAQTHSHPDDDECPVCWADLHRGERYVECAAGCRVRIHSDCMAAFANEMRRAEVTVVCPLCESKWKEDRTWSKMKEDRMTSWSKLEESPELPKNEPISQQHWTIASGWISLLGRDLVACLFSKDWVIRETALRRLEHDLVHSDLSSEKLWRCLAEVIRKSTEDKVFKVYFRSIQCFGKLLTTTRCTDPKHLVQLRGWIKPILQNILLKCADGNPRIAQLSIGTFLELSRDLKGDFGLGKHLSVPNEVEGLGGVDFLLQLILEDRDPTPRAWQWFMGRLVLLDNLLQWKREDFVRVRDESWECRIDETGYNRLMVAIDFSFQHLNNPHLNVSRLAREVFVRSAGIASSDGLVYKEISALISTLDPTLQATLKRQLRNGSNDLPKMDAASAVHCGEPSNQFRPSKPMDLSLSGTTRKLRRKKTYHSPQSKPYASGKRRGECQLQNEQLSKPRLPDTIDIAPMSFPIGLFDLNPPLPIIPGLNDDLLSQQPYLSRSYSEGIDWSRGPILGTGAYSSCCQGRDSATGTLMAVKQMSLSSRGSDHDIERDKFEQQISDEIGLLSQLRHPHVMRIFGAAKEGGVINIFAEWMPGGSVAGLLDRHGPFRESVILRYGYQLLMGLDYLHYKGILHRDLKGANLLVDTSGHHLRIADFGAATRMTFESTMPGEFRGQLEGTIAFMAPEVLRGESYGRSCDVWSVGCCLIEMATARPPWNAANISNHLALIFKIACSLTPPPIPTHLSEGFQNIASKCLQLPRELRPSAKELLLHQVFGQRT